jgi:hypothetical protein
MKKLIILVLLPIFFALFGCSKDSPVSSTDSNNGNLTDAPDNWHYHLTLQIIQHTGSGDVELVNSGYYSVDQGESSTYYFTTENTSSTFTLYRTVEGRNISDGGRTAIWEGIATFPVPNGNSYNSWEYGISLTPGNTYPYKFLVKNINGDDE